MSNILYMLYCDWCHWKRLVKDEKETSDLYEMKISEVQKSIPKLNKENGKTIDGVFSKQKRKFRCPQCGRYCFPRAIPDIQKNLDDKIELDKRVKERKENEENWFTGRKSSPKGREV